MQNLLLTAYISTHGHFPDEATGHNFGNGNRNRPALHQIPSSSYSAATSLQISLVGARSSKEKIGELNMAEISTLRALQCLACCQGCKDHANSSSRRLPMISSPPGCSASLMVCTSAGCTMRRFLCFALNCGSGNCSKIHPEFDQCCTASKESRSHHACDQCTGSQILSSRNKSQHGPKL